MTEAVLEGVRDRSLERPDGRIVAWSEFGDEAGLPWPTRWPPSTRPAGRAASSSLARRSCSPGPASSSVTAGASRSATPSCGSSPPVPRSRQAPTSHTGHPPNSAPPWPARLPRLAPNEQLCAADPDARRLKCRGADSVTCLGLMVAGHVALVRSLACRAGAGLRASRANPRRLPTAMRQWPLRAPPAEGRHEAAAGGRAERRGGHAIPAAREDHGPQRWLVTLGIPTLCVADHSIGPRRSLYSSPTSTEGA